MKDIPGYEGKYACDENGNVYSLARLIHYKDGRTKQTKLIKLKPCTSNTKSKAVGLRKKNHTRSWLVHRLIALTFLGFRKNIIDVNHIDGDRSNNKLENLEYCTRSYNIKHAFRIGLKNHKGENHPGYKIDEVIQNRALVLLKTGLSQDKIGKLLNISQVSVSKIKLANLKF